MSSVEQRAGRQVRAVRAKTSCHRSDAATVRATEARATQRTALSIQKRTHAEGRHLLEETLRRHVVVHLEQRHADGARHLTLQMQPGAVDEMGGHCVVVCE